MAVLLVVSALAGAGGYVVFQQRAPAPSHAEAPKPSFATTSNDVVPSASTPAAAESAPTSATPVIAARSETDAGSPAVAPTSPVRVTHSFAVPAKKPRKSDCDPPFTVLPDGIKRVKPQCL